MGSFAGLFVAIAFCIMLFLVLRQVMLWYWKVETIIRNQDVANRLLDVNNSLLKEQIALMKKRDGEVTT